MLLNPLPSVVGTPVTGFMCFIPFREGPEWRTAREKGVASSIADPLFPYLGFWRSSGRMGRRTPAMARNAEDTTERLGWITHYGAGNTHCLAQAGG